MSKPANIQFTGTESLDEIFTKLPSQYQRSVMLKIFAKAASKFIRDAKKPFNGSLKKTVGTVNGKSDTRPSLWAGLVRKGGNSWPYQRAYWRNFGTLDSRDPSHTFVKSRKSKSSKWRGGITPINAIGSAWEANAAEAARVITQDAAAIANKFLQSKAKRK
ncbi:MAG: hypothetical protein JXR39_11565 [Marinilabiliaceae bacterium]|nr:hypothetical protein [Marinilabiliaceae bacterium]